MIKKRRTLPKYCVEYKVRGKPYVYFRRGDQSVRLRELPGSDEFNAEYRALLAGEALPEPKTPAQGAAEQTFAWLCLRYMASSEFGELDPRTQRVRRQILQSCIDEPTKEGAKTIVGSLPLGRFIPKVVSVLRDRKRDFPEAANGRVKAIRAVYKWACLPEVEIAHENPARDVQYLKPKNREGFHTWTLDEVEQFETRHPIGTKARLALALGLYTFQRRSDIHRIGRAHERNNGAELHFTQFKGRNKEHPVTMTIPVLPELRAVLDATPLGDMVYLVNQHGVPFSAAGFGNWFRKRCDEAGLPQCSAHGLRKAAATRMAENGATPHEIQAWTGHRTLKEVVRYTQAAEQRKLAKSAAGRAGG